MTTERGTPCPAYCEGAGKTEYVALLPVTIDGKEKPPHEYSVCPACYAKQWEMTYPGEPCPIEVPEPEPKSKSKTKTD